MHTSSAGLLLANNGADVLDIMTNILKDFDDDEMIGKSRERLSSNGSSETSGNDKERRRRSVQEISNKNFTDKERRRKSDQENSNKNFACKYHRVICPVLHTTYSFKMCSLRTKIANTTF